MEKLKFNYITSENDETIRIKIDEIVEWINQQEAKIISEEKIVESGCEIPHLHNFEIEKYGNCTGCTSTERISK